MHLTRIYLRASRSSQDAERAREQVEAFAAEHNLVVVATYTENESGAKLARPELFRLLSDSKPGDVLLVEQVDRLSRLTDSDWRKLRAEVEAKGVRIVALDLPTSWMMSDRMTKLECAADAEERRAKAEDALSLAESLAEAAPQALLSSLADRPARLH
jgi:DNA invertase Pin-like site-specific DNA recombinase